MADRSDDLILEMPNLASYLGDLSLHLIPTLQPLFYGLWGGRRSDRQGHRAHSTVCVRDYQTPSVTL